VFLPSGQKIYELTECRGTNSDGRHKVVQVTKLESGQWRSVRGRSKGETTK